MASVDTLGMLPEQMRPPVSDFAELLRTLGGDNVLGLTLIGAIAAGSFAPERDTARSVMVVRRHDLSLLRRIAEHGPRLGRQRISAPLVMTPEYIQASLDTFPLEFLEITQNRVIVFGNDYFSDLEIADSDVRYQCERELKVLAMSLRQSLLAAAGRDRVLAEFELGVGEGMLRIMRGMLWIKGRKDPQSAAQVFDEIEHLIGRRLPGIRGVLDSQETGGWERFEQLYHDLEALGESVDAW